MGVKQAKPVAELPEDLGRIAKKFRAYNFPFENLVLEGGGAKGIAYIGAMKVLEDAGIMQNVKRFAGTSAGAITAGFMSIGMTADEIVEEMGNVDMGSILMDSPCCACGPLKYIFFVCCLRFGFYTGERFMTWYGEVIHRHLHKHHKDTGLGKNINLLQLRDIFSKELCTVTYNLTYGIEMYCHAKTTPLCTVVQAVRQSMSLPVVFVPFMFVEEPDRYIDGGVCANFPIYCFDGWWLSMDDQDSFNRRLEDETDDVKTTSYFYRQSIEERFQSANVCDEGRKQQVQKTLGLMLYSKTGRKAYQHVFSKRLKVIETESGISIKNERPETRLARKYQKDEEIRTRRSKEEIETLRKDYESKKQRLDEVLMVPRNRKDMLQCFKNKFPKEELRDFGEGADSHEVVFEFLFAKYPGGPVTAETINSIFNNWEPLKKKLMEVVPQRIIRTPYELNISYLDLVGQSKPIKKEDVDRCIAIDVDYVNTLDFDMETEDQTFLMRQGALATLAFLEDYVQRNSLQPSYLRESSV